MHCHDLLFNMNLLQARSTFLCRGIIRAQQPTSDFKEYISSISSVKAIDKYTVQIKTKEPNPILLNDYSGYSSELAFHQISFLVPFLLLSYRTP